jgi:hypothetical protein
MTLPEISLGSRLSKDKVLAFAGPISIANSFLGAPTTPRELLVRSVAEAPMVLGLVLAFESKEDAAKADGASADIEHFRR